MDYSKLPRNKVLIIDMKSFYASVEAVNRGYDPLKVFLAVVGDTNRPGSVVLASSPAMKKEFGIKTGNRLYEIPNDPRILLVNPRMGLYLQTSMELTKFFNRYAPYEAIHTYSVDESWLIVDGLEKLYGSPRAIAENIMMNIKLQFGLPCAIGIGPNKLLSKLVLDNYAKKSGIAECTYEDVPKLFWPLPVEDIWGIGRRMKRNLNRLGIYQLGDLARYSLQKLKKRFGVMGEQLYYHAWGVDLSPLYVDPAEETRKGFSNGITLMRDYSKEEIHTVIYELTDHIAARLRNIRSAGRTVSLSIGYSKNEMVPGYSRSRTLPQATNISKRLYDVCMSLLMESTVSGPIRTVHVSVSNLVDEHMIQLDLFSADEDEKLLKLGSTLDAIHSRYGKASIFRAASLTKAGTILDRANKTGGHRI